jgi:hypothetical protein
MSRLETRVKPILIPLLGGCSTVLTHYDQEVLATWISMKLMTCEFSVPEDVATPATERTLLMGRRIPPEITAIWIGHYKGTGWGNVYVRHAASVGFAPVGTFPVIPSKELLVKNVQAQTFFIGELFVQAVTTTVRQLVFQTPPAFVHQLRQIWPYRTDYSWPPQTPLFDFHAHLLVAGFDRFIATLPVAPGAATS